MTYNEETIEPQMREPAPAPLLAPPELTPAPHSPQVTEPDQQPEPQPEPLSIQDPPVKAARRKTSGDARQRALILRTARKTLELHQADALTRSLLSAILSTTTGADDLAYAAIIGGAKSIQPAVDALSIIDADALEAGIHAAALGRNRLRAVWRVFGELDVVSGEAPASDAKAAIALVRAIHEGDTTSLRADIEAAIVLTKK